MNADQVTVKGRDFCHTVWFAAGPRQANHPLCVFLDGEHYLERMGALSILEESIASGRIPPMSFAFVSHNGPQARHEDYICNDRFGRYVSEDIVLWAKNQLGSIRIDRNVICGLSLSGLASAHIALRSPHVFSSSLSQSGSFWWNRQRFASLAREYSRIGSRYWLSVGDEEIEENVSHPPTGMRQEVSQITGVQSAADALKAGGAEIMHHVYRGGHAFEPWRDELTDALQWLVDS